MGGREKGEVKRRSNGRRRRKRKELVVEVRLGV